MKDKSDEKRKFLISFILELSDLDEKFQLYGRM